MKKLLLGIASVVVVILISGSAFAYTVDGAVTDWNSNINFSAATSIGYFDNPTLFPTSPTARYVTEDNAGAGAGWIQVGPGWSNGNTYDAEAMYFDHDATYAYVAVITGLPMTGASWLPGDIAFDTNGDYVYDAALTMGGHFLSSVTLWNDVHYLTPPNDFSEANPFTAANGTDQGALGAYFAYVSNLNSHYVIESRIPLSWLGVDANSANEVGVHWTMGCGNDYLNLKPAPEPATFSLLGLGLVGLWRLRKKQ